MNENATDFGKRCKKLRVDKGWSMTVAAGKLGKIQSHLSQIEQGKANPTAEFLEKCLAVYEIPDAEKADFIAQGLASSKRIVLELDKILSIPKQDLAKLLAVIIFNLKGPYPASKEWEAVVKALKRLFDGIQDRSLPYTLIREDD